jgi:predicted DNA-binding transcriptional regulator YafY
MDRTERFQRMIRLLESRRSVPRRVFTEELGVSLATFKRDLEYLTDRLNAPIVYDRSLGGYRIEQSTDGRPFQLPGAWFTSAEAHALLTAHTLLKNLQPGLLAPYIDALALRIRAILGHADHSADEIDRRLRVFAMAAREVAPGHFETISSAVLARKRLNIHYYTRGRDEETERVISPQRLVHYRDNWYLDAWCHWRNELRIFALDGIRQAATLDTRAKEIPAAELDRVLGAGYGIFSGAETQIAVLRFTPERARWVTCERWHPDQNGRIEPDGSYTLAIPYSDARELVLDILKYGPDVEVIAPAELRAEVIGRLREAIRRYDNA